VSSRSRSRTPVPAPRPVDSAVVPLRGAPTLDLTTETPPQATGRRVGLFGGTFDPPHVGHLVTAVNVRHALDLDVVMLMVANVPWQKEASRAITPAADRLAMVEAAVADVPGLEAGRLEIDLGGPSYTADTLAALSTTEPGVVLFTIVGDDAAAGLTTWERYEEVVTRSRLVVVDRPGEPVQLSGDVPWIHVEVPRLEVSSTDLRARFTDGRPLDYLVTDPVLQVIEDRGLYGRVG
jgi:nicotinate-nucleotide adenylyltransferase